MSSTPDLTTLSIQPKNITSFTWQIDNFLALEQTRYDSPMFCSSIDKTKFFLAIHPKGSHSFWNNSHTLIYLYLKSCDKDALEVKYKVAILDCNGTECNPQGM